MHRLLQATVVLLLLSQALAATPTTSASKVLGETDESLAWPNEPARMSPDNAYVWLVNGGNPGGLHRIDVATRERKWYCQTLNSNTDGLHSPSMKSLDIQKDNSRAAVGHSAGYVALMDIPDWSVDESTPTCNLIATLPGSVNGLVFAPDGSKIFASSSLEVYEIDTASGNTLRTFSGGFSTTKDLQITQDGSTIYMAEENGNIQQITVATGVVTELSIPTSATQGLALFGNDQYLLFPFGHKSLRVYEISSGAMVVNNYAGFTPNDYFRGVAITQDGSRVFATEMRCFCLWEIQVSCASGDHQGPFCCTDCAAGEYADTCSSSSDPSSGTCSSCGTPPALAQFTSQTCGWECDAGLSWSGSSCSSNSLCGNGELDVGEECDDANQDDTDACLNTCVTATCGDGSVQAGVEECDDGNALSDDGCSSTCATEFCGDGIQQAGEGCDDANQDDTDACLNTCEAASCGDGFVQAGVEGCDDGNTASGDGCDAGCASESTTFTPFGAAMTAPLLGACPTSESSPATEAAWAAPEWGRCWSSTITATKSAGMIDTNNDWAATLSLTDGLGTNYYVTAGGATTTWTIYWREQDLTPNNGGYSQDITITVTETIAAASSSATDVESQVFTVTLARDLFGSVSSATDAGVEELVSFANARMHRVEGAVSAVYYAALTFIASGGTIDVDITEVTAKGTADTWPKLAAASKTSYNPCPLSGAVNIAENPYPSDALLADCAPSLDLCSTDKTIASRVDVYIPLDLGTTFDTALHSVTLVMVVKDTQSNNFQEFYISISPSNGFVTWCDSNLAGIGAPDPKDVLSVDFHVGLSDSSATWEKVTDGERADLVSGSAFTRTGSIIAMTASAKGGHDIRLEDVKVFWDFDGSVTPNYGVSYSATDGAGQLTAQHSGPCSSLACKEVAATASGQEDLFHTYATDLAAKDFIQPSPRTSEVDTLLGAYLSRITVPSEGTLHNTYLVDPTVELSSPVATVYVFALFKIVQQDGSARRMLLQQAGPTSRGSDGAASAAVRFDVTPAAFAAYTLDISPELVTSWNLQLQTSEADACLPSEQLLQNVRTRLLVHLSSAATALRDVQIVSLTVKKAGVSCSASRPQRRRKLLAPAVAGPFVTVEALFIFDDAEATKPAVNIAKLQAAPGVLSVLQTQSSSATSAVDIIGAASPQAPAPLPSSSDSSSPSALHLTLAAAAGAALVVAVLGVLAWVRRKSARRSLTEVQAAALNLTSQTVSMDKIQIECGQRALPIDDAATTAVATTTVKLTPGPMETLASLSEARPGSRPVLPHADSQKHLLQSN